MKVNKFIKRQIAIEVLALLFLIAVIIYSLVALKSSNDNEILNQDGMVIVLDTSKFKKLEKLSDGEGLMTSPVSYIVTNNNEFRKGYKLFVVPSTHDEEVLKNIRVVVDDLYIDDLVHLERYNGGYVISDYTLDPGFTKSYSIKYWFKLDSSKVDDVTFDYRLATY